MNMNWDYIAGFFDGEGNIRQLVRNGIKSNSFVLSVSQKESEVLDIIGGFLKDNNITFFRYMNNGCAGLRICRQENCLDFLNHIVNKLVVKRDQAERAIVTITDSLSSGRHRHYGVRGKLHYTIKILREAGFTYQTIKETLHCGNSTIQKVIKEMERWE